MEFPLALNIKDTLLAPKVFEQTAVGQMLGSGGSEGLGGLMGLLGMMQGQGQGQDQQQPQQQSAMPPLMAAQNQPAPQDLGVEPMQEGMNDRQRFENYQKYQNAMSAVEAINSGDFNALVRSLIMNA